MNEKEKIEAIRNRQKRQSTLAKVVSDIDRKREEKARVHRNEDV